MDFRGPNSNDGGRERREEEGREGQGRGGRGALLLRKGEWRREEKSKGGEGNEREWGKGGVWEPPKGWLDLTPPCSKSWKNTLDPYIVVQRRRNSKPVEA